MRPKHWQLMDLTHKYEFKSTYVNIYYRQHPNDGEGTVFTGVCLHLMGGYPSPRFFPRSLVLGTFWEVPQSCPGGLCQSWPRGVPQNMGTPLARTGLGYPPPARTGLGSPPPPPPETEQQSEHFLRGCMPLAFTQENFLVLYQIFYPNETLTTRRKHQTGPYFGDWQNVVVWSCVLVSTSIGKRIVVLFIRGWRQVP